MRGLHVARELRSANALARMRKEEVFPGPGIRTDHELAVLAIAERAADLILADRQHREASSRGSCLEKSLH